MSNNKQELWSNKNAFQWNRHHQLLTVREVTVQGCLCPRKVSVQRGLCPGGSLSGVSVQGVSVQAGLYQGLCLGSLSRRVSVRGVYVQGVLSSPVDRQTPVKPLPCPKLHLGVVTTWIRLWCVAPLDLCALGKLKHISNAFKFWVKHI